MNRVLTICGMTFLFIGIVFGAVAGMFAATGAAPLPVALVFGGIGAVLAVLGAVFILHPIRRRRTIARLLDSGARVQADIAWVGRDRRFSVNGRHPWVIQCVWRDPDTGREYTWNSESCWFDPQPYLDGRETLPVCYDPAHPRRHVVDTRGILPGGH